MCRVGAAENENLVPYSRIQIQQKLKLAFSAVTANMHGTWNLISLEG